MLMVSQQRGHAIRSANRIEHPSYVFTGEALRADIRVIRAEIQDRQCNELVRPHRSDHAHRVFDSVL